MSAIILGGNVTVANDATTGAATPSAAPAGSFAHIPPCAAPGDVGCVVAYSSFGEVPPQNSIFGRVAPNDASKVHVLCTNPAALGGGTGKLQPYLPSKAGGLAGLKDQPAVSTPWVTYPDLFEAECKSQDGANWLQVDDVRKPGDTRPHATDSLGPAWGYHLLDVNIALGNLVTLVRQQSQAWTKEHGR